MDNTALFKIGYGLYALTANDGDRDNGCIINTLLQVTSAAPFIGVITVNKQNYTHDMIFKTKEFNISILTVKTPFDLFKRFGFQSGRTADKFAGYGNVMRSANGIIYLQEYANAFLSFNVTGSYDFGTHTMFRAEITDGLVLGGAESVTYSYYQQFIKPKPQPQPAQKNGYRCNICGYFHEGDYLPDDFSCPVCKHGAGDFIRVINQPG